MDLEQLIIFIEKTIATHYGGSQKEFAKAHGISAAYVNDILNRRKEPGKKILDAVGVEKVVTYRVKNA